MSIKLGSGGIIIPYPQAYVGNNLVFTKDVGDALLTETNRPITTESGEYIDYESVPYTMLDWIESTGTQWIDTNVQLGGGFKVECKIKIISYDLNHETIIGSHELASPYHNNFVRFSKNTNGTTWGVGERTSTSFATSLNTDYTIEASTIKTGQYLKINGTNVITSQSTSVTQSNISPYIFARNNGSDANQFAKIRLYYLKLYNSSNDLVRDFIPVIDENNVVCLYDIVTETYFYNQGTGQFIPSETTTYKTLSYIQSTGTQYIDTEIIPTNTYKIDCNIARTNLTINDGVHGSNHNNIWGLYFYLASNGKVACAYGTQNVYVADTTTYNDTDTHHYILNLTSSGLSTSVDGASFGTKPYSAIANGVPVYIFKCNDGGTGRVASIKLHSFAIYNNNVLVRNYIPVLRKSDNVPCLYDLVNDTFYTNAGTGTFLYG